MGKFNRKAFGSLYKRIDVPMDKIYTCFYCGSLATDDDHVPAITRFHDYKAIYDKHPPLLVPACSECNSILTNTMQETIFDRFDFCKKKLVSRYSKILQYGDLWDEEQAEYAEFTGAFATFAEQAKKMSALVKERLEWIHWPISIDGEVFEMENTREQIQIFNKKFTSMDHMFEHVRKVDKIPTKYLQSVLDILGENSLQRAYVICKNNRVKSEAEMRKILADIKESLE